MNRMRILERFKESIKATQFNAIKVRVASPEQIRSLSYGEVKKIETINYRTLKPEKEGLFCPRIFGPVQDWACICGKYKRMKHRGIVCEKCGVEVIESRVRRERMGHIELIAPVAHIWYLKGTPSYLALIMDMTVRDLERVIYFEVYIVVSQGKSPYPVKTILTGPEVEAYLDKHPEDTAFEAEMGAESIQKILEKIDLEMEIVFLQGEYEKTSSTVLRSKLMKRIKVFSSLKNAQTRPEWMVMTHLPVIPPDLRPLVPLDGGRFASSDLNELYRRVINRNIRLRRLIDIHAPRVIIKNEKRMLQESVDALIDNGKRTHPVRANKRPLKSLSEMLRGKQGRFRQNLLGKRVDYSGRSVIVVDPELKINQCGLPKLMALELFKSHVLCELIKRDIAPNIRVARKIVENMDAVAWDVLEDVVRDYPVMLNRAPTLHRLGIQAFYPILVDSKAIKIHPLVTTAYNADFDGDQMGVYIPLSQNAIQECKKLILSSKNLLTPQNARPVMTPHQDMVLGIYYLTKLRMNVKGEGSHFASVQEVFTAYACEAVHLHAQIKLQHDGKTIETSVGRVLVYNALPKGSNFEWVNKILNKGHQVNLIESIYYTFGNEATIKTLDNIKHLGFLYATKAGMSFTMDHLVTPQNRMTIIDRAEMDVEAIEKDYLKGKITSAERYNKIIALWGNATSAVAGDMTKDLTKWNQEAFENKDGDKKDFNFLYMTLDSKARGSTEQTKQLIGMRGLMAKPSGEIIETPVRSNFKKGLTVFEYFVSTHGARKGQADTALKTANAGYLTRRLVDVAQDVIVAADDCHTSEYLEVKNLTEEGGEVLVPLHERVYGRFTMEDVYHPITKELIIPHGHLVTREVAEKIQEAPINAIKVRSVVKCHTKRGVCTKCYGLDLSQNKLVTLGTPVGIIAAQSIGEPGTQLTLRTFHIGGTASLSGQAMYTARHSGVVNFKYIKFVVNRFGQKIVTGRKGKIIIVSSEGRELQKHSIEYGSILYVEDAQTVDKGAKLVEWDPSNRILVSEAKGKVSFVDLIPNATVQNRYDDTTDQVSTIILDYRSDKYQPTIVVTDEAEDSEASYHLPVGSIIDVVEGEEVIPGDILVKFARETSKSTDITTGGLPRIAELFEARMPKDPCIISEIDGEVVIGSMYRGMRKISVIGSNNKTVDYLIPRSKQLNVVEGDFVRAGDILTSGLPVLQDITAILGTTEVQKYLVDQIHGIYSSQGIKIDDRHFELIVRQMTRKVRITDPGSTDFLVGDKVDRIQLHHINQALKAEGKDEAQAESTLMGITLASLGTESFISAASFQETTRILSEAAVSGQVDHLYGLKENVIIGKLIPAGTGFDAFKENVLDAE